MTALPAPQDIVIVRGDPWALSFSSRINDTPEPIDAAKVLAQIRTEVDGTVIINLATHVAVAAPNPDGDIEATISLTATETAALPVGRYVWDLQPDPAGETWIAGHARITADVSKPVPP